MKSVCIVIYRLGVGGAEQVVVSEIGEFVKRGYLVRLITLCPERERTLMHFVPVACETTTIEFRSIFDVRALRALARRFRETKPDIIITQMWFANTVGRIAARMAGLQDRILSFEQNVYDKLHLKSWKQFLVDRFLQRWCRKVIAVSRAIKESLVRSGIDDRRIVVIYDAIDMTRLSDAVPSSIKSELGIEGEYAYLFVGRLVPQKGVDVLLDAFAKLQSGALLIAGDGIDRAALERQAASLGIAKRVSFLGVRHDIPSIMKAVDCFVLASRLEGLGMVLVEAIVCGLPVVATRVDGIPEVVEDGKTGILVAPDDASALSVAMREIRENPQQRLSMRSEAAMHVRELFSIEHHIDQVLALF